jgi:hypothetical protein
MTCDTCTKAETRRHYPFSGTRTLDLESHHGIDVGICIDCGHPAVMYWVEIHDQIHEYACGISDLELGSLLLQDSTHSRLAFTLGLIRSRDVAYGSDQRGFVWLPGTSAMLTGPAW